MNRIEEHSSPNTPKLDEESLWQLLVTINIAHPLLNLSLALLRRALQEAGSFQQLEIDKLTEQLNRKSMEEAQPKPNPEVLKAQIQAAAQAGNVGRVGSLF